MNNMRNKVLAEAKRWVGYLEKASDYMLDDMTANAGQNNYTRFAREYCNLGFGDYAVYQAQPWCAMAVTVIFYEALGYAAASKILTGYAYCPYGVQHWKNRGRWHDRRGYVQQPGDIIFFTNGSVSTHTGIVRSCDGERVYTYEGNTSDSNAVVPNGGAFCAKSYTLANSRILGYGNPDWAVIEDMNYGAEYLDKLKAEGIISNKDIWQDYDAPTTKAQAVSLIDKATGGQWKSDEADNTLHWVQPNVISLCGKKIISDKEQWLNRPDIPISKALLLALADKATGGTKGKYKNRETDHWSRNNLDSLCDKGIITNPEMWTDFESQVRHAQTMALVCKAFKM